MTMPRLSRAKVIKLDRLLNMRYKPQEIADDKQWEDVVAKRRTGFSIHGSGKRVEKML